MEINNTATQNVYDESMSEYARGQHPNNPIQKGNTLAQKGEKPLTERVMIRLTEEQLAKLDKISEELKISRADIFRKFLDETPIKQ